MPISHEIEVALDNYQDLELVSAAQRRIMRFLDHSISVKAAAIGDGGEHLNDLKLLKLPRKVMRLFADMLDSLAQGRVVTVATKELEITPQEAAMFLNVSRSYLIRLLEEGKIPCHYVGAHRRICYMDVVNYKECRQRISKSAQQKLVDQSQDLDLGY